MLNVRLPMMFPVVRIKTYRAGLHCIYTSSGHTTSPLNQFRPGGRSHTKCTISLDSLGTTYCVTELDKIKTFVFFSSAVWTVDKRPSRLAPHNSQAIKQSSFACTTISIAKMFEKLRLAKSKNQPTYDVNLERATHFHFLHLHHDLKHPLEKDFNPISEPNQYKC